MIPEVSSIECQAGTTYRVAARPLARPRDHEGNAMVAGVQGDHGACRFRLVDLEPGDILFSTNPNSLESNVIRRATRSPFSHVAIYRGEFNFLEAADFGVSNFNHKRFGIHSDKNVRLFRLRSDAGGRHAVAALAAQAAEKYRELDYWTPGAILSAFKKANKLLNFRRDRPSGA